VELPEPVLERLANGLQVAVFTSHAAPSVQITLNVRAGGLNDPPDVPGAAWCMFHLLRRGSRARGGDELAELLDARAMSWSTYVGAEESTVALWTLREHLPRAVSLLAEIVREPSLADEEVRHLVDRTRAQLAIQERDAGTQANRALARALYGDHYLARPVAGASAALPAIDRDLMVDLHARCLAAEGAVLIFAGSITPREAFDLSQEAFGTWAGRVADVAASGPDGGKARRVLLVDRPGAPQSEIRIGQLVTLARGDEEYPEARLVSHAFGEAFSSRLNRLLRVEHGLTYGARGGFRVSHGGADFRISTFTRAAQTVRAIELGLQAVADLRSGGLTAEELSESRDTLVGQFLMSQETPTQAADRWWDLRAAGLPDDWYAWYQARLLEGPRPDHLRRVLDRLDPGRLAMVVVGDAAHLRAGLEPWGPVQLDTGEQL
jgi:zinc protease